MARQVSLKQVAEEVGVSATTVSIVINGRFNEKRIRPEIVARVQAAAVKLGYRPDLSARQMRAGGKRALAIAFMTANEAPLSVVSHLLKSIDGFIKSLDHPDYTFSVSIETFRGGSLREALSSQCSTRYHGLLLANTTPGDDVFLESAVLSIPVVLIGRRIHGFSSVYHDLGRIGEETVLTLKQSHAAKLAIIRPASLTQSTRKRMDCFIESAISFGYEAPDDIICEAFSERSAFEAMNHYLRAGGSADGLFAISDQLALGAYHSIKIAGKTIPGDIAIMGYDDLDFSPFLDPPLSTYSSRAGQMYEEAARTLVRMLTGELNEPVQQVFQLKKILRESTGNIS